VSTTGVPFRNTSATSQWGQHGLSVLSYALDRKSYWPHTHVTINNFANVKSKYCYKCSLSCVLNKCRNCWRSFHPHCHPVANMCLICETTWLVSPPPDLLPPINEILTDIIAVPDRLREIYGFDTSPAEIKSESIKLFCLLDMIYYHRLVYGLAGSQG